MKLLSYQFSIECRRNLSQANGNRHLWVLHRPAGSSTVETLVYSWTSNDYSWTTLNFTHIMSLSANDQISVGAYTGYTWHPDVAHASFSGQLIG